MKTLEYTYIGDDVMPNSKNVRKLRKSRKYSIGAEHETGGGTIKILDRYVEDGTIFLKYLNLDTKEEIINKEVNVNRLIYDFQQKGKADSYKEILEGSKTILEAPKANDLLEEVQALREDVRDLRDENRELKMLVMKLCEAQGIDTTL